jgi:hypothetical protein
MQGVSPSRRRALFILATGSKNTSVFCSDLQIVLSLNRLHFGNARFGVLVQFEIQPRINANERESEKEVLE